ncbi:GIY-YIG catalytic domain protein [[Clostridium] bifermentans ATCC 19299]|uniref:GIY-YIG nuclease family protein n=1 Tax=Paraclostridium bifermentans TaxID=1490 RepID=UPI00038D136E|nr:GIY-YIG nuclease family protein [Paraclostridium bifermentans]EQK41150.1 GIY-YIG catalytic domain protein [[Clostridium] bifermentans ATCC 19299] [Paraclostridium bifermentans ATCC 19299]
MAYVYRFIDQYESIIYIGYTGKSLDKRVNQHFQKGHLPDKCYKSLARIEYIKYATKSDAMVIETYMINKYKPIFNKLSKQNDTITLNLEIEENWNVYRSYKTTTDYKESCCSGSIVINIIRYFKNTIAKILTIALSIAVLNIFKLNLEKFTNQGALDTTFTMLIHYFLIGGCILVLFSFLQDLIKLKKDSLKL